MVEVIKWCMELGVKTISVYAFSIENFKRNEAEVEFLMKLSQEKFQELMEVRLPQSAQHVQLICRCSRVVDDVHGNELLTFLTTLPDGGRLAYAWQASAV